MKEYCQKQIRKLLVGLMKILSVTKLYLKMLNPLVIKTVLPLPPVVHGTSNKKKKVGKYDELEWQKDPLVGDMKKQQFIGTPGISYAVQSTEAIDIFEMMITDDLVEYITKQTNLCFKQNISGKIFKPMRHLINSDGELCNSIDIRLYIASLLYRTIIHKHIAYMYCTQDLYYLKLLDSKGFYHKISWH